MICDEKQRLLEVYPEYEETYARERRISTRFGVYRTLCCDAEIVIGVGAQFSDCPKHKNLPTEWKLLPNEDPATYVPKRGRIDPQSSPPDKKL